MRIGKFAVAILLVVGVVGTGIARTLAVSPDNHAEPAIADFRARGPEGLETFLREHEAADLAQLASTLDAICQQYDCASSRLFWYTDLDAARAEARRSGKPILSLRLLGKLSEELSCANSRFFRALVYADPTVADYLKGNFVLHWKSVRPVPQVTIDFGDGRLVKRTLTGNSIHYVLDADGRVVDGLPGLYSAPAFLAALARAVPVARESSSLDGPEHLALLTAYHREQLATPLEPIWLAPASERPYPTALEATQLTMTKAVTELPMLRALDRLENSVADDTEFNERNLHQQIHHWLAWADAEPDLETFNERVYGELFLTPSSDPWLGLVSPDAYDAITNHGLMAESARHD